ncbi:(2Fe-2S)-binding protein [Streptomyces sp. NPDC026206]|uniref:(2Fe-2S)-binding protein n=1 Tax=Streptomyces sp. NPDC026206 TaxID=3157089 RepID=UPI0033C9DDAF
MSAASAAPLSHGLPAVPPAAGPFADTYARLTQALPALTVLCGPPRHGAGWVTGAELAAGGPGLDAFLAWDDEQVLREYGQRARPDVVATFGLHRYAWHACLLITVPWFLARRVPRLPAEAVSFHRETGRMTADVPEFACLPEDPAAALPGARPVADAQGLRVRVRSAVAEHLTPVLEGFRPRMRRGARALWGMATDETAEGLWHVGRLLGEERRARHELALLLPGATAPFAGGAAFRELSGPQGGSWPTRDRASCCFLYTLRPEDTCVTCPRTSDSDRIGRLSAQ